MAEALMLMNFLSAAVTAGANMTAVIGRVSDMIRARNAAGTTFSQGDLMALLDEGDAIEAAAAKQFAATLADPNTPKP